LRVLNKVLKYISKLLRSFDVSPIGGSSVPKLFFYVIWGLNSAIFLGEDFIQEQLKTSHTYDIVKSAVNCTVVKKVSADAYVNETFQLVNTYEFGAASSADIDLVYYDVIFSIFSRGPPAGYAPVHGAVSLT
jgi:hypothetical protein